MENGCRGCLFLCRFMSRYLYPSDLSDMAFYVKQAPMETLRLQLTYSSSHERPLTVNFFDATGKSPQLGELEACEVRPTILDDMNIQDIESGLGQHYQLHPAPLREETQRHDSTRVPRLVAKSALSDQSVLMMKDWLQTCARHSECRPQSAHVLPTRLLDLTEDSEIRLSSLGSARGEYVILSHSWGKKRPAAMTTKSNMKHYGQGIESDRLPRTFRDAVSVTRKLGYQYLWIDTLCIVQDDPADWALEASQMAQYYANAALMISATDAPDCETGLFSSNRSDVSPPLGDSRWFCLRRSLQSQDVVNIFSPLNQRGWTLQEKFLAPRIIHFLRDQMYWECGSEQRWEGYLYHPDDSSELSKKVVQDYFGIIEDDVLRHKTKEGPYQTPADVRLHKWHDCVAHYTSRSLTHNSDKLAAMAGLAERFAHPSLGDYLAGHWEYDFFSSLAWIRQTMNLSSMCSEGFKAMKSDVMRIDSTYRAPSWSWSSTDVPICLAENVEVDYKRPPIGILHDEYEHWDDTYAPNIVSKHLVHSKDHKNGFFDALEGSYLEVEGYCRELYLAVERLAGQKHSGPGTGRFINEVTLDEKPSDGVFCYFNLPKYKISKARRLLILQIAKQRVSNRFVYALMLEKVNEAEEAYRRVGLLTLACYNLCQVVPKKRHNDITFMTYVHPVDRNCGYSRAWLKTKEWQKDKWEKRTLKLI